MEEKKKYNSLLSGKNNLFPIYLGPLSIKRSKVVPKLSTNAS